MQKLSCFRLARGLARSRYTRQASPLWEDYSADELKPILADLVHVATHEFIRRRIVPQQRIENPQDVGRQLGCPYLAGIALWTH